MDQIAVVPSERGKFKVLVNFIQRGIDYATARLANLEAGKIKVEMPHAKIQFVEE